MKDEEIDRRFAQADKDWKAWVNVKVRAWKNSLPVSLWINKHPWKSVLILFAFIGLSITIYLGAVVLITGVDVKETIETKTGIKFKQ